MKDGRSVWGVVVVVIALAATGAVLRAQDRATAPAAPGQPVAIPRGGVAVQLTFGLKDAEPTDWDGSIRLSEGRVLGLDARLGMGDEVAGSAWKLRSRRQGAGMNAPIRPVSLYATFDAPPGTRVEVTTGQGRFSFTPGELSPGRRVLFLEGAVAVEAVPLWTRLTSAPAEEDFPVCATAPDGTVWCASVTYQHGNPIDRQETNAGRFGSLVTRGHGDQITLTRFDGSAWSAPLPVTAAGLDVWRPTVAVDGRGMVWVAWSQKAGGDWELFARGYDPRGERWSDVTRLTSEKGGDVFPVAATGRSGRVWLAWQDWEGDRFGLSVGTLEAGRLARRGRARREPGNVWNPAIAADAAGKIYVAYDAYTEGGYDVFLRVLEEGAGGGRERRIPVAASPRFEARPSLAVDARGRAWIAYEDSGPEWGKDYGSRWEGKSGVPFYIRKQVVVRCVSGDRVQQTREVTATPVATDLLVGGPAGPPNRRLSFPRLGLDGSGRLWLLFRRHPMVTGAGERWAGFAVYLDGDRWSPEIALPHSDNLMDNRPALAALREGGLLAVYSSDERIGGTNTAQDNNLYAARLQAEGRAQEPVLADARPGGDGRPVERVHPDEAGDIRRIRAYRARAGGRSYQLLRGEFHRHTEISSHRDQDGPFEELWRYGLDVARMDWIGPGDHDNGIGPGGMTLEYTWWLSQKQIDLYHHAPTFVPMFTYERSVVYPSGHRNVIFARRGIRPLPRMGTAQMSPELLFGTPETGSPDIKNLYAYLKLFGGICSSHTSATNMGTDWRDHDREVEPVVEIYQGHRQNYEEPKAPLAAKGPEDSIGGYQPAGFVWNAFAKGHRLGFQVSSDHVSTHISYAIVFAERPTREAIVDAFRKRHSYGAHDNIILDVRCGEHMMGDEFTSRTPPRLEITVIGTGPVAQVDIVRQIDRAMPAYVYAARPGRREVKLSWTDSAARPGAVNMYYVRIMQADGKLAWASPLWIRYQP